MSIKDENGQARFEAFPPLRDSGFFFSLKAPQAEGSGLPAGGG